MVFLDVYVWAVSHCLYQSALYLCSSIVGMVQYAKFRMATFAVKVKLAVLLAVEVYSPLHQFLYLRWCISNHLLHGFSVADKVSCYHRVFDMLVEIIHFEIGDRSHSSLCK